MSGAARVVSLVLRPPTQEDGMDATLTGTAVRRGGRLQDWLLRYGKKLSFGRAEPGVPATMLTDEPMPEQATPEPPTAEAETAEAETADDSTPERPTAPMAVVGWASAEEIRPTPVVGWFPGEAATAELRIGSPR
jgi:hypothetical protein